MVLQNVSVWDDIREVVTEIFLYHSSPCYLLYLPSLDIARDLFVHLIDLQMYFLNCILLERAYC
jgi:hypothetical protein